MSKIKFTKKALLALQLPPEGKRVTFYDTEIPKLALRLTATGSRTFYVIKRSGASMAWMKLGPFPEMTVEQARVGAHKILAEFAEGANPAAARRAIREELTFIEALTLMLERKKKRDGSPISENTKRDYLNTARLHLTSINNDKLSHISRSDLKTIHSTVTRRSARQADKAVAIVSSVYNFAADQELFGGPNPASSIQKNPAPSRDRFAQAPELPFLLEAIEESSLSDFFMLALLTGARRSNLLSMAWRDLNLSEGIWRLGTTKNGTPQNVTLSPEAVRILKARKHTAGPSHFVFPGTGKSGHLVEPKKAWLSIKLRATTRRILEHLPRLTPEELQIAEELTLSAPAAAYKHYKALADTARIDPVLYDMTDLRIHDLRRTLGSWQAKTGASLPIIGRSLNHKSQQATAIYARLDLDPVRDSVQTATAAMLDAAARR